ncbi:MAG: hypothetical protein LC776_05025 [Acidobacteria bacterium]|nr:hypothetical protein [Acidobacteriota bacterium]
MKRVTGIGGIFFKAKDAPEYGRFAWIMDPEGNRLELWEPLVPVASKNP